MKSLSITLTALLAVSLWGSGLPVQQERTSSPTFQTPAAFSKADGAYRIDLRGNTTFGKWVFRYTLPAKVDTLLFRAEHDAPEAAEANRVPVRIVWLDAEGRDLRSSYLNRVSATGYERTLRRPAGATTAEMHCGNRWPEHAVTFRNLRCLPVELPNRPVRIAVAKITPKTAAAATCEDNQFRMQQVFDQLEKADEKPDLVVFPETLLTRWVADLGPEKGAQPIPGPHTRWLSGYARKLRTNIVASLREKRGEAIYCSAVVIDRDGKLVGRYSKTQLTVGEYEEGYTPGEGLPVFDLDFGRIGVLICWDLWFPEAVRSLRLKGAEIIAYPIASTSRDYFDAMWQTRARENGIYLAASISGASGECPARIVDPSGRVLAETKTQQTYAVTTVDLSRPPQFIRYLSVDNGEGEGGNVYIHERNPELFGSLATQPLK